MFPSRTAFHQPISTPPIRNRFCNILFLTLASLMLAIGQATSLLAQTPQGVRSDREHWPEQWSSITKSADHVIGVDRTTGVTLFAQNPDDPIAPASMAKMMTIYLLFNAITQRTVDLTDTVNVSKKAWRMGGSRMFITPDQPVSIEDLLRGIIVSSGNDAAVAVAEHLSGSEQAFALLMNDTAQRLGMINTDFANASGWPDPLQMTTVRDLAILAHATLQDFPELSALYQEQHYTYGGIAQPNRNVLLQRPDLGVVGLKTGYTEASGYGIALAATRGERSVLVVFSGASSKAERTEIGAFLVRQALTQWRNVPLFAEGETLARIAVLGGTIERVPMTLNQDLIVTVPLHQGTTHPVRIQVKAQTSLKAPIEAGTTVGQLIVENDNVYHELSLLAGESVPSAGFWKRALDGFWSYWQGTSRLSDWANGITVTQSPDL